MSHPPHLPTYVGARDRKVGEPFSGHMLQTVFSVPDILAVTTTPKLTDVKHYINGFCGSVILDRACLCSTLSGV